MGTVVNQAMPSSFKDCHFRNYAHSPFKGTVIFIDSP